MEVEPQRRKTVRKLKLEPGRSWDTNFFACPKDILLTIIGARCLDIEAILAPLLGRHEIVVPKRVADECRDIIRTVLSMQRVCVMFYDVIDHEKGLWARLYQHTRYYIYKFTTRATNPPPLCSLKEFVILDTREYALRESIHNAGHMHVTNPTALHYEDVCIYRQVATTPCPNKGILWASEEWLLYEAHAKARSRLAYIFSVRYRANKERVQRNAEERVKKRKEREQSTKTTKRRKVT